VPVSLNTTRCQSVWVRASKKELEYVPVSLNTTLGASQSEYVPARKSWITCQSVWVRASKKKLECVPVSLNTTRCQSVWVRASKKKLEYVPVSLNTTIGASQSEYVPARKSWREHSEEIERGDSGYVCCESAHHSRTGSLSSALHLQFYTIMHV